jgi:predicted house-cleaning noncanonical NTP pyrophosphatase (MazG superfamily)
VTYGKLVRDRIPDIIRAAGEDPEVRILDGDELIEALFSKLDEEAQELRAANHADQLEELADLFEVLQALADRFGTTMSEVQRVAARKRNERGGFALGVWLVGPPS